MDFAPFVIVIAVGAIALFDILAVVLGADTREPMLDDHQR